MVKQYITAGVIAVTLGAGPALALTPSFDVPGTWPADGAFDGKKSRKSDAGVKQDRTTPLTSPIAEPKAQNLGDEAKSR